jgi:hypothetical protein
MCEAGGVKLEGEKDAASEQATRMVENTLPGIVDAAVKAYMVSTGVAALGSAASCLIPDAPDVPTEVPTLEGD